MPFDFAPFRPGSTVRTRYLPEVGAHLRARYETLVKQLNLGERARREALENRPLQTETQLDAAQREILNEVEARGNAMRQFLDSCLDQARGLITRRAPEPLNAKASVAEAMVGLNRAALEDELRLKTLWKAKTRSAREVEAFKRKHWITHEAQFSDDELRPFTVLIWLWIADTVLNIGAFQAAGGGILGGALAALSFSAVNLLLGLVTGVLFVRALWHHFLTPRLLGTLGAVVAVAVGVWINVYVAHYRQNLEETASHDPFAALERAVTPGQIGDLGPMSVCLLLLGLIFYALALVKGVGGRHGFVDPYWMYKARVQPWRKASAAYDQALAACQERMRAAVAAHEGALHLRLENETKALAEARDIAAQAAERADEICDSLAEWRDMGATLLTYYRNENMAVRTTPPPGYFSVFPDLRAMVRGVPDGRDLVKLAERAADVRDRNLAQADIARRKLTEASAELVAGFVKRVEAIEEQASQELRKEERESLPEAEAADPASPHPMSQKTLESSHANF